MENNYENYIKVRMECRRLGLDVIRKSQDEMEQMLYEYYNKKTHCKFCGELLDDFDNDIIGICNGCYINNDYLIKKEIEEKLKDKFLGYSISESLMFEMENYLKDIASQYYNKDINIKIEADNTVSGGLKISINNNK